MTSIPDRLEPELRTRVAAHENGQWVRDAANAYAAKHGKQAA